MNSSKPLLDKLPLELFLHLSYFLDIDSFVNLRNSCKILRNKMNSTKFVSVYLQGNSILRSINLSPSPSDIHCFFNQVFRQLVDQSDSRSGKSPDPLEIQSIAASTTERNQFVYLTEQSHGFWSSLGTANDSKEEYLIYKLSPEIAIPTLVFIEFAFFSHVLNGSQVFPSKYVQVEFSFVPNKPIYTTPKYELLSEINDRTIEIPILPKIVAARYMKVKFFGMQNRHVRKDNLFYICVENVLCFGHKIEKSNEQNSFGDLIHRAVQNYYIKPFDRGQFSPDRMEEEQKAKVFAKGELDCLMIDEGKEEEIFEFIDIGYDIERHNQLLLNEFKTDSKKNMMNFISLNLHLLDSEPFFRFLMSNEELGVSYLTEKAKKCNFLNPHEVTLYLQLIFESTSLGFKNDGNPIQILFREKTAYLRELFSAFVMKSGVIQRFLAHFLRLQGLIQDEAYDDNSLIICSNKGLMEIIKKIITGIQKETGIF